MITDKFGRARTRRCARPLFRELSGRIDSLRPIALESMSCKQACCRKPACSSSERSVGEWGASMIAHVFPCRYTPGRHPAACVVYLATMFKADVVILQGKFVLTKGA